MSLQNTSDPTYSNTNKNPAKSPSPNLFPHGQSFARKFNRGVVGKEIDLEIVIIITPI